MADAPKFDPIAMMTGGQLPTSVEDLRGLLDGLAGFLNGDLPKVGGFQKAIPLFDGVTADLVTPTGDGPFPVLVYLHGGGWVSGSPTSHNKLAHRFAEAGFLVLNVDYRMAPEHPFPVPFEDCVEALRWAKREIAAYGGDPDRIAVGGDSAGGNLSAAAAIALDGDEAKPRAALLIYGVFDFARLGEEGDGPAMPGLDLSPEVGEQMVEMMVGSYLGALPGREPLLGDARVSPIHAAAKLPPCHVVCGGADPLSSQADSLVEALRAADVEHETFTDADMPHGYVQIEMLPPARPAIERMIAFLRKQLG